MNETELAVKPQRGWLRLLKKILKWALIIFVIVYVFGLGVMGYRAWKTPAAVERIHARMVTRGMVMGEDLPPYPSIDEVNKTVAGFDVNENGVRDDVEIEISRRHPDSAKVRAAQLQYAMALQSQLTDVFSEKTLVAALQETERASLCIDSTHSIDFGRLKDVNPEDLTEDDFKEGNAIYKEHDSFVKPLIDEVEALVFNTARRQKHFENSFGFMTGHSGSSKAEICDVDLDSLPN